MDKLSSTHAINVRNLRIHFSKFSKSLSFLLLHAMRLPQIKSVKCGRYFRECAWWPVSVWGDQGDARRPGGAHSWQKWLAYGRRDKGSNKHWHVHTTQSQARRLTDSVWGKKDKGATKNELTRKFLLNYSFRKQKWLAWLILISSKNFTFCFARHIWREELRPRMEGMGW